MKTTLIAISMIILMGCSKIHQPTPTSKEEFVAAFSNYYESGQSEALLDLIYNFDNSEYSETLEWLMTSEAGKLKITFTKIIGSDDDLPEGFEGIQTMDDVEPNIEFNHILCIRASNEEGTRNQFSWPFGDVDGHWYLAGLRKVK